MTRHGDFVPTADGFWARTATPRYHWFRDIGRLSACCNRFAVDDDGRYVGGIPPVTQQCARCARRLEETGERPAVLALA